ncbi:porin [Solimicrobium silvestre]|uniref:Gram-negative porin n=1 Tax=Solimicrobium silvestre TaxID=2099400 RepID=A0A2S9GUA8_9BURK|nr:porin [Solimicrobium silvestre]PRC91317.1 Gram-negative porin [Solimicrobium silvestre]
MNRCSSAFWRKPIFILINTVCFLIPAMAQTNVTVSGLVDAEVNSQTSASTGQHTTSINGLSPGPNGGMQSSYLQFAGNEDLGGGMKASFTLGTFFRPGMGSDGRFDGDPLFSRDANVSLSGDFGGVTLGRQISPLYLSTLLFNPFADSFSYSPIIQHTYYAFSAGNVISADSGYSNAISYSTPNFSGLSAKLLYSLSGESGVAGSFSGNLLYFNGPFAATVAYENSTVSGTSNNTYTLGGGYPAGTTQKIAQLGASYDFAPVKLFFQYQNTDTTQTGLASLTLDTFQLGTSIAMGQGNVLASYAKTGGAIDHKTFSVGYDYNLSKSTDIYMAYMNDQATAYAYTLSSVGIGIRKRF